MLAIPIGVAENGKNRPLDFSGALLLTMAPWIPFGLGIIQTAWKEHLLIKFGSAIEDLVRGRRVSRFLNVDAENFMSVGVNPKG